MDEVGTYGATGNVGRRDHCNAGAQPISPRPPSPARRPADHAARAFFEKGNEPPHATPLAHGRLPAVPPTLSPTRTISKRWRFRRLAPRMGIVAIFSTGWKHRSEMGPRPARASWWRTVRQVAVALAIFRSAAGGLAHAVLLRPFADAKNLLVSFLHFD